MQADVRHDGRHKAAVELSLPGQNVGADRHDLVAVDLRAVFVHGKAAVCVAVKRDAQRVIALAHPLGELLEMRRAALVVDVDAVGHVIEDVKIQIEA